MWWALRVPTHVEVTKAAPSQAVGADGHHLLRDPVCGMEFEPNAASPVTTYDGVTHQFCSAHCREAFTADPRRYHHQPIGN